MEFQVQRILSEEPFLLKEMLQKIHSRAKFIIKCIYVNYNSIIVISYRL